MSKKGTSLAEEILFSGSCLLDESSEFFESPAVSTGSLPKANSAEVCPACAKNLTNYTVAQRQQHINNCLDSAANRKCLMHKRELWKQTTDCPLCGQPLNSGPFRQAHLKRCGKANNVPPNELLRLMHVQEKIAETRKLTGLPHTRLKKPTLSSIRSETACREKDVPKSVFDEQVLLARALSRSVSENEIAPMELPTVSKSLKQTLFPTKLEMTSPGTRLGILEGRLSDLLAHCLPPNKAAEEKSKPRYLWPSFESDGPVYCTPEKPYAIETEDAVPERMEPEDELTALREQRIELLLADLSSLLQSEIDKDVEMFCGPTFERCKAHSLILKSRCPSLLKCSSERPGGRYDLFVPEIALDCMRSFLRYLYFADEEFFNLFPSHVIKEVLQRFPPSGWSSQVTNDAEQPSSPEVTRITPEKEFSRAADFEDHCFISGLPIPECRSVSPSGEADVVDLTYDESEVAFAKCSDMNAEVCSAPPTEVNDLSAVNEVEAVHFESSETLKFSAVAQAPVAPFAEALSSPVEEPRTEDGSIMPFVCAETLSAKGYSLDMFNQASFPAMDDLANSPVKRCSRLSPEIASLNSYDEGTTRDTPPAQGEIRSRSTAHVSVSSVAKTSFTSPSARMSRKLVKNAVLRTPVMQKLKQQGLTVMKTVDVTPSLDFARMTTPELQTKLRRYGVRALPKRTAVKVLQRIYNETHPYVHEDGTVEVPAAKAPVIPRKRRIRDGCSNNEISPKRCDKRDVVEEYSLHQLTEEKVSLEESFFPCIPKSNSPEKKGAVSDDDQLRRLLTSDAEIYEEILTYTPLNLKNVHRRLKQEGARCSLKNLLNFLDAQCITFSMKKFNEAP